MNCRSCNAPMIWAHTANGKPMPIDAEPHSEGFIRLHRKGGKVTTCSVLKDAELEEARYGGEPLYRSHHMTCPQGKEWKR